MARGRRARRLVRLGHARQGPSIVVVATVLFALGLAVGAVVRGRAG